MGHCMKCKMQQSAWMRCGMHYKLEVGFLKCVDYQIHCMTFCWILFKMRSVLRGRRGKSKNVQKLDSSVFPHLAAAEGKSVSSLLSRAYPRFTSCTRSSLQTAKASLFFPCHRHIASLTLLALGILTLFKVAESKSACTAYAAPTGLKRDQPEAATVPVRQSNKSVWDTGWKGLNLLNARLRSSLIKAS